MWVAHTIHRSVVLAVNGSPSTRVRTRRQPEPKSHDVCNYGVQLECLMGNRPVQVHSDEQPRNPASQRAKDKRLSHDSRFRPQPGPAMSIKAPRVTFYSTASKRQSRSLGGARRSESGIAQSAFAVRTPHSAGD